MFIKVVLLMRIEVWRVKFDMDIYNFGLKNIFIYYFEGYIFSREKYKMYF